jgi:glycosyltransferase involved in cell wall biosynthesis
MEACRYALFVGRLHPVKGLDILISALKILKQQGKLEFRVLVVGDGDLRPSLEERACSDGVDQEIVFAGPRPHKEIPLWLSASNVFCLPSRMEGLPNVVLESLASGVPVVASAVGGIPELIVEGVNGFLVEPGEPESLASALLRAMNTPLEAGQVMETVAWADWAAVAASYARLYRDATDS